jgi:peptidoglycan/LPS O-acetylase OafA/YrhL
MPKYSPFKIRAAGRNMQPGNRLQFLDVTRGLAALAVVLEHSCEHLFPGYLKIANSHFTFGVFGVSTFFLVSGFIIPVSIERHGSLSTFWHARFFRLYPMYWFSILAGLALGGVPLMFGNHPWRGILANVTMFQTFLGVPNFNGLYWTLTMEMIFYLLCSGLFLANLLSKSLMWVWIAVITNLAATASLGIFFHRSLPAGRSALLVSAFFGTLLYRYYRGSVAVNAVLRLLPVLALSLLSGFWFRFQQFPTTNKEEAFKFAGVSLSYLGAYLLFSILYCQRHRAFPEPLLWLGRISYSLYLMHGFVFAAIPAGPYPFLRLLFILIAAVIVASATFILIERPALELQRRLLRPATPVSLSPPIMSATR